MATEQLETRVSALEVEIARLKKRLAEKPPSRRPWWKEIAGGFANDPIFEEAMRLGERYRRSLRPTKARRTQHVRSRHRSS
jgi:hypothetical protein